MKKRASTPGGVRNKETFCSRKKRGDSRDVARCGRRFHPKKKIRCQMLLVTRTQTLSSCPRYLRIAILFDLVQLGKSKADLLCRSKMRGRKDAGADAGPLIRKTGKKSSQTKLTSSPLLLPFVSFPKLNPGQLSSPSARQQRASAEKQASLSNSTRTTKGSPLFPFAALAKLTPPQAQSPSASAITIE